MFYSLKGTLTYVAPGLSVIECGGVGYKCFITTNTQKSLPALNSEVKLYTHLNVREDAVDLFGFASQDELNCFKMLTSVSGVGAKVGISILSELSAEQVATAIASNDSKTLTRAAGVGNKLAQRIILELRDKLKNLVINDNMPKSINIVSFSSNSSEAINALSVLGYTASEVAPIVAQLDGNLSVEELIRLSLKAMAGRK